MHMYLKEKKEKERKKYSNLNYLYLHRSGVSFRVRLSLSLTPHSQLPWPVPGSEIIGSAKLRKRDHENKTTGGNCRGGPPPPAFPRSHTHIFGWLAFIYASSLLSKSLEQAIAPPNGELVNPPSPMDSVRC